MQINAKKIPECLKQYEQWVCWKYEERGSKTTKIPLNPSSGRHASVKNPEDWQGINEAIQSCENHGYDGIGFVFTGKDNFVGIDIDHCLCGGDPGPLSDILDLLKSYTEYSPSGNGLHIICKGKLPEGFKHKNGWLEIYDQDRFFTFTGRGYGKFAELDVAYAQDDIEIFCEEYMEKQKVVQFTPQSEPTQLSSSMIKGRISEATKRDPDFKSLWLGDTSAYPSRSEADMAMATKLAFWFEGHMQTIERAMLDSGLKRDKWEQPDGVYGNYLRRTIHRSVDMQPERYEEQSKTSTGVSMKKKKQMSPTELTLKLFDKYEHDLFINELNQAFATVYINGHHEHMCLDSEAFKEYLTHLYYVETNRGLNKQSTTELVSTLKAKASHKGQKHKCFTRIGKLDDKIYIDLANDAWEIIEISEKGWDVVQNPKVKFVRNRGMKPLPRPVANGSFYNLKSLINISDEQSFILIVAWLIQAASPDAPYPILNLEGEQGSAKSTTTKILRELIDPHEAPIRSLPKSEKDLFISATSSHILCYDNLSGLNSEVSDSLCRLSTGGGTSSRELYTNSSESILQSANPVILNSIDQIATRSDLVDRSIMIHLPPISNQKRTLERDLWAKLKQIQPGIFGCICNALSSALRNLIEVVLPEKPRMADFVYWITAAEPGLPWEPGEFLQAYNDNMSKAVNRSLHDDDFTRILLAFMKDRSEWTGTMSVLLQDLRRFCDQKGESKNCLPKGPSPLSSKLNRSQQHLRRAGLSVEEDPSAKRAKRIFWQNQYYRIDDSTTVDGKRGAIEVPSDCDALSQVG